MTHDEILELLKPFGLKRSGDGHISRCPGHDDQKPSLSISCNEHGDTLLHCHAGCSIATICSALGIRESDLFAGNGRNPENQPPARKSNKPTHKESKPPIDFAALSAQYETALTDALAEHHAKQLGISVESLRRLHVGWDEKALTFPMKDAGGNIIGVKRRFPNADKSSVPGSKNGLFIPDGFDRTKRFFICEGPTDLLAAMTLGLNAIARSNCSDSVGLLTQFCAGCDVVIIGDADTPGRKGAEHLASKMAIVCNSVRVIEPQKPHKDLRDWLRAGASTSDLWQEVERARVRHAPSSPWHAKLNPPKPSLLAKLQHVVPYVPFPIRELPAPFDRYVEEAANSIRVDPSLVALPLLAAAAGAVGNARCVLVKFDWFEPCALWTACIKESGEGGTPAFKAGVDPLRKIDRQRYHEYQVELAENVKKREAFRAATKAAKNNELNADAPKEPAPPSCVCHVVSDITIEALATVLEENPRGVLYARDELSGFVRSHNEYKPKGGSDTANWLSMYSAEDIKIHRKTGEQKRIFVRRAIVSITGTIQPGVLRRVMNKENHENGMLARFFLSWPPRQPRGWSEKSIDESTASAVARVYDRLTSMEPDVDEFGDPKPVLVRLSREAKELFIHYYNELAGVRADAVGDDAAAMSKLVGGAARLALVHHLVRLAANDQMVNPDQIDGASMAAGIALAKWFAYEAIRVNAALELDSNDDVREARHLIELIESRGGRITPRELQQRRSKFKRSVDLATEALQELVDAGIGEWNYIAPGGSGGQPSKVFVISTPTPENDSNANDTHAIAPKNGGIVDVDGTDTTGESSSPDTGNDRSEDQGELSDWNESDPNKWAAQ